MKRMDRRQFTKDLAFLSGITITVSACGGGGGGGYSSPTGGTPPPTTNASGDKIGQISANHGHQALVTSAQVAAENAVTINIEWQAGHPHMISLPAAAMRDLRAGRAVQVMSTTTDGHNHAVTFGGEGGEPPNYYG